MSSSSSAARDEQLLAVGTQCSHSTCNLVDFLPFKCQHCEKSFCQEHFKAQAHSCPNYDETKYNRVAPNCPLCNEPVAIRPGQDPNVRMEDHFDKECTVMTGRRVKKSTPVCARGKCGKVLFAPIRCDKCKQEFCPAHRFPSDHSCTAPAPTAPRGGGGNLTMSSRLLNLNSKATSAAATVGAIKTSITQSSSSPSVAKTSHSPSMKPSSTAPAGAGNNPFSKTDSTSSSSSPLPSLISDALNKTDDGTAIKTGPEPVIRPTSFAPPPIFSIG